MPYRHPTGQRPTHVDVVALGASAPHWVQERLRRPATLETGIRETWTVNRGIRAFAADLAFVLDDIEAECRLDPGYGESIKAARIPIISTSTVRDLNHVHRYPGREILDCFQQLTHLSDPYWHNSIPMVIAYAAWIGVEELRLWGADYTDGAGRTLEADRACCEYWIALARVYGMRVGVPSTSTLLGACERGRALWIYGLVDQSQAQAWLDARYSDPGSLDPDLEAAYDAVTLDELRASWAAAK